MAVAQYLDDNVRAITSRFHVLSGTPNLGFRRSHHSLPIVWTYRQKAAGSPWCRSDKSTKWCAPLFQSVSPPRLLYLSSICSSPACRVSNWKSTGKGKLLLFPHHRCLAIDYLNKTLDLRCANLFLGL